MTDNPQPDDLVVIRELLLAAFTSQTLRSFCLDRPLFRPILAYLNPEYNLNQMIDEVIDYCRSQILFDELLTEVEKEYPRLYAHFEPNLHLPTNISPPQPAHTLPGPIPRRVWGLVALLVADLILILFWGWCLFGDQPGLVAYLRTAVAVVAVCLGLLALFFVARRPVTWEDALHRLGTKRNWSVAIVIASVLVIAITGLFWPLGWLGKCVPPCVPSPTASGTPAASRSPTPSHTPSLTPLLASTPTASSTPTTIPTREPTYTAPITAVSSPTPTQMRTPAITPTPSPTGTPSRTPAPKPSPTTSPSLSSYLVAYTDFQGPALQDYRIWWMRGDGSERKEIAQLASGPAFSPDGRRIAYYHWSDGLYMWDRERQTAVPFLQDGNASYPTWAPDGQRLAYFTYATAGAQRWIRIVRADGSDNQLLTSGMRPSWSPKGDFIAYDSCREVECGIFRISPDGKDLRQLTRDGGGGAAVSPDGTKIAYWSQADGDFEIYVVNADGANGHQLTSNRGNDTLPAWSPDGQFIYYLSDQDGRGWAVMAMNVDGSNRRKITGVGTSPDGWEHRRISVTWWNE